MTGGTLYGIGLGPGDPELVTLKAARLLATTPVIAFFAAAGRPGHARTIADGLIGPAAELIRMDYPFTLEIAVEDPRYRAGIARFYDDCAARLAAALARGRDCAVLCEGDPFFYGSFMYLFDRLHRQHPTRIVPGITGMAGCWSAAAAPMTQGDDMLCVLPGTLPKAALVDRLRLADAAVIMKVGRNLAKIREALAAAGLTDRALYVERGTMAGERIIPLADKSDDQAPYFALVLVPGRRGPR